MGLYTASVSQFVSLKLKITHKEDDIQWIAQKGQPGAQ
jgi:hypothetical protein